jgi:hypothetical protein
MTTRPGWRGSVIGLTVLAGTVAAVVVGWLVGFRQWADGRTPGDLADGGGHEDPTGLVEYLIKGTLVGTVYAFVTFAVICAAVAGTALTLRRRRRRAEPTEV